MYSVVHEIKKQNYIIENLSSKPWISKEMPEVATVLKTNLTVTFLEGMHIAHHCASQSFNLRSGVIC